MNVTILKDVFEDNTESKLIQLDRLWHVIENQHRLCLKDDEDIEALMESEWYRSQRKSIRDVILNLIIRALNISKSIGSNITISDMNNINYFSVEEAIGYLRQPFVVLLENCYNDAPFIDSLLIHFYKEGKEIKNHKEERWLKYSMGGGSTIVNVIKSELRTFENEIFTKEKYKYLRYFVIIDSDKEYPEMPLKREKNNLISFLNENDIRYHVLEKREMENYLPDEAFNDIVDNREYTEAYLRLNPTQKDFFDIENGLPDKRFSQISEEIQSLYNGVSEGDLQIFRKQSLKKVNNSERENFKTAFPLLFCSDTISRDNLLQRCEHHSNNLGESPFDKNELPNLLIEISKLL